MKWRNKVSLIKRDQNIEMWKIQLRIPRASKPELKKSKKKLKKIESSWQVSEIFRVERDVVTIN